MEGRRDTEVLGEAQHVGGRSAQDFQQEAGFAFAGSVAVAGGVGQPDQHSGSEPLGQGGFDLGVDPVAAGVAGEVGFVDQLAQRVGDLGGPVRVGVDLTRAVEVAQQVLGAELMDELAEFEGVIERGSGRGR